jgi:hypothetical protein
METKQKPRLSPATTKMLEASDSHRYSLAATSIRRKSKGQLRGVVQQWRVAASCVASGRHPLHMCSGVHAKYTKKCIKRLSLATCGCSRSLDYAELYFLVCEQNFKHRARLRRSMAQRSVRAVAEVKQRCLFVISSSSVLLKAR